MDGSEEGVVVGSVGHVIKRAFQDLFVPATAPPASASGEPDTESKEVPDDAPVRESTSVAPASVPIGVPAGVDLSDPRAADELRMVRVLLLFRALLPDFYFTVLVLQLLQIDERLHAVLDRTKRLEQYLWDVSASAADMDVKQAAELREKGLILGTEVPLGPSHLAVDRQYLEDPSVFGGAGKGLLIARDVMAKHELHAAIRSGNAGQVGKKAPDFVSTAEDPNYLKMTHAQVPCMLL